MTIVTPSQPGWDAFAVEVLQKGGIVLHPTDTAYGLAADIHHVRAIEKIYAVKKRDHKPLIIVVKDIEQAKNYVELITAAEILADNFFPGALTLVLNKKDSVHDLISGFRPTVGIRQPNSPITAQLSELLDSPYTSTSANLSGGPTPYSVEDALSQLDHTLIDLAIDVGPLPVRPTSTVIDLTVEPLEILREGPISKQQLLAALGLWSNESERVRFGG